MVPLAVIMIFGEAFANAPGESCQLLDGTLPALLGYHYAGLQSFPFSPSFLGSFVEAVFDAAIVKFPANPAPQTDDVELCASSQLIVRRGWARR